MKYEEMVNACVLRNRKINLKDLSDDGIDVEKEIKELEQIDDVSLLYYYIVSSSVIDETQIAKHYYRLFNKIHKKSLSKDNITPMETIVMDLLLSFSKLYQL